MIYDLTNLNENKITYPAEIFDTPGNTWRKNQSFSGGKLCVGGKTFNKGFIMHANNNCDKFTEMTFDISDMGYEYFVAHVGIDDAQGDGGSCEFIVLCDGKEVERTRILTGDDVKPYYIKAVVSGAKNLTLRITNGGNDHSSDWAVWVNPVLGYEFEQPTPTPVPTEKPIVEPTESPNVTKEPATIQEITATPTVKQQIQVIKV